MIENLNQGVFESDEEVKDIIKPLVDEDYSYENIMNNPILKPISQCDKSVRNLEEIKIKTLRDSIEIKAWINKTLIENPEYNNINFVAQMVDLIKKYSLIVKLGDLQGNEYRECINEGYSLVRSHYAVRLSEEEKYNKPESKIDKETELDYLTKISNNENTGVAEVAKIILDNYQKDNSGKDSAKRFNDSCMKLYYDETDTDRKKIISKIVRREYG